MNSLQNAFNQIIKFHDTILSNNWLWTNPLVNLTNDNEIVFEWWNKDRKLTIYFDKNEVTYIKVYNEGMSDGILNDRYNFLDLYKWLIKV